jgi:hypothetical protein
MGKLLDWLAFEAMPLAIERSPVRRLPHPVRVVFAISLLIALAVVFALFALIAASQGSLPV